MQRPLLAALLLSALATPMHAEVPKVVTDGPVAQSLVAQVMGDLGTPAVLLEQGANAHSYQLRPSQAAELQAADLVVWIGPQMSPWLDRSLDSLQGGGKRIALLAVPGTRLQDFGGAPHEAGHDETHEDHDADHDEEASDAHGHVHTGLDPHAWLNPENAALWLSALAADLGAADPENAATYAANAEAAKAGVMALDAELKAELAPVQSRPFVVFHAAYDYFAAHYGLAVAGAVAMGDAAEPGAAHLAELRETLNAQHVVCAFPEANHDPKQIDMLLEGTGVRRGAALDPEGSSLSYGPGLYAELMRGLAGSIVGCLAQ